MTYGIRIESGNGSVQIDSDYDDQAFIVTDYSSSATSVTYNPALDLVFARPVSRSGVSVRCGLSGNLPTSSINSVTRNFQQTPNSTSIAMEVVVGRFAGSLTTSTSGYGIQIFNDSGDLAYDSQQYQGDGGFNVTEYVSNYDIFGDGTSSLSVVSTDVDSFVCFNLTEDDSPDTYFTFDDSGGSYPQGIRFTSFFGYLFGDPIYGENFNPIWIGERGAG